MLYTEGKWWRIGNDYLNERLNGGKGSSDSSGRRFQFCRF